MYATRITLFKKRAFALLDGRTEALEKAIDICESKSTNTYRTFKNDAVGLLCDRYVIATTEGFTIFGLAF